MISRSAIRDLDANLPLVTVAEGEFLSETRRPTSLAGDLRIPPPPPAASAAGGWGIRRSWPVYSVGYGRTSAGGDLEVEEASVVVWLLDRVPSRGGAPRSSGVWRSTSSSSRVLGSVVLGVLWPVPQWRRIWSLKTVVKMVVISGATKTALLRVGSLDPAIGDFPVTMELALIQGLWQSSGSGAPPSASARRLCRGVEEEGLICNFRFLLYLSVRTLE